MLEIVKDSIQSLPKEEFSVYYQEYVKGCQDNIIKNDLKFSSANLRTIEDLNSILKGLNVITDQVLK